MLFDDLTLYNGAIMNLNELIIDTLLSVIEEKIRTGDDDFNFEEIIQALMSEPTLKNIRADEIKKVLIEDSNIEGCDETDTNLGGNSAPKNKLHPILHLALKPILSQELRELLQKIFRNDPEAKRILTLKLTKGELPRAICDFIIGVLTKGLKHQYDGPREVLTDVLLKSNVTLRHEYSLVMNKVYQNAMEHIANPQYQPRTPSLKPTLYKKGKKGDESSEHN